MFHTPSLPTWHRAALPVFLLALAGLAGCATHADIQATATVLPSPALGLDAAATTPAADRQWWRAFGDRHLDALVEQALRGHPSLRVAQSRIARASAGVAAAGSAGLPQVNGSVDLTRQRYTEHGAVPAPLAGSVRSSGTLQASASWELDFFGRHRAVLEAALGTQRAAEADLAAARLLLASQVAHAYVQLARWVEQREVAVRTLAQREQVLALIRQRVEAGLDTNVELRQGEAGLPEMRQQIASLDEQIDLTRHALAALTAQPAVALADLSPRLDGVTAAAVPGQLGVDLLGRRADVAAARWRVEAASRQVDAGRADFYPNVNLVAFAGLSSIGLDRLLEAGSRQVGFGPAVRLPIFDAGRLRAGLRGRTADLDAAIETYNTALLDAVRDVADQVTSARSVEVQRREQAAAQAAAESAYDLALQRYRAGLGSYLTVLSAENGVLAQRRLAADLRARALDAQVGLARALGGGHQEGEERAAAPEAVTAARR